MQGPWQGREPGGSRAELVALERAHVWPPYTSRDRHEGEEPLVVARAEGIYLFDMDGRRYIDACASWWTSALGHGHPRLRAALIRQSESLMHCSSGGITHAPAALLAKELTEVAPEGLTRVHFSDDGSTSVEAAIKIAFQYWQQNGAPERRLFLSLSGAYHGDTLGAASLASLDEFHRIFAPLLFSVLRPSDARSPGGEGGWERAFEEAEAILRARPEQIAGVIVEPLVQGAAGMRMYPPALLRRLREVTRELGTFLICDEVFTGYGRTGAMWACDRAEVAPDLMCVAKGFSGGVLPMGATLATEAIYDGFRGGTERALLHGHSFCGNPLGAAVAREVLAIFREEGVVARAAALEAPIREAFEALGELPGASRPRALGAIGAIDLGAGGYLGATGWKVHEAAKRRGAHLRPLGDTVYVAPPLNITEGELETLLSIVGDSVREVLG